MAPPIPGLRKPVHVAHRTAGDVLIGLLAVVALAALPRRGRPAGAKTVLKPQETEAATPAARRKAPAKKRTAKKSRAPRPAAPAKPEPTPAVPAEQSDESGTEA